MGIELSVVIPTYNEEESIIPLYNELTDVLTPLITTYEIIFIDDGSTDSTFSRLKQLQEKDTSVKIIKLRSNFGQSAAMKAGFDHAPGKIIITIDSDLQNDPHDIPALLKKMKEEDLDVVCGWRFNRRDSFTKRVFSKISNRLRKALTQETIHDSGCTLRAYKGECVKDLELYGELHRYIPAILLWRGYHVGEVKTNHRQRSFGASKYNWKRLPKGFLDLLVITFWQKYSTRPIHIFGGVGIFLTFAGFFIILYLILERTFNNIGLTERPLFLVGFFLIVLGVQFFAIGILADILLKIYYGRSNQKNYLIQSVI